MCRTRSPCCPRNHRPRRRTAEPRDELPGGNDSTTPVGTGRDPVVWQKEGEIGQLQKLLDEK
jgi:hypothetical protein